MGKRKTKEDYVRLAESKNGKWLGPEVKNIKVKTLWVCEYGHQFEMRYNDVQQGHWCPHCAGNAPKTPEDYKNLALSRGFRWWGPQVENTKINTLWCCESNHFWWATFNEIDSKGNGCPHCYGNAPKKPSDYHALAESFGYTWEGSEVVNTRELTQWGCGQHVWSATYGNIRNGCGCPYCAGKIPKTPEDYHELAVSKELVWEGPFPENAHSLTVWRCEEEGHVWESTFTRIRVGSGCPICLNRHPKTPEDYHDLAASRAFTWEGPEVPTTKDKTGWRCNKNHEKWFTTYNEVQGGRGCPKCHRINLSKRMKEQWASGAFDGVFQSPTSIEIEVCNVLDTMGIEHISQYRPPNYSCSFDEFIPPDLFLELHGDFWHGPHRPKRQKKDAEKAKWAKDHGYHLVVFWEHEINKAGAYKLIEERVLPLL